MPWPERGNVRVGRPAVVVLVTFTSGRVDGSRSTPARTLGFPAPAYRASVEFSQTQLSTSLVCQPLISFF
jgi:hypothetical protein